MLYQAFFLPFNTINPKPADNPMNLENKKSTEFGRPHLRAHPKSVHIRYFFYSEKEECLSKPAIATRELPFRPDKSLPN